MKQGGGRCAQTQGPAPRGASVPASAVPPPAQVQGLISRLAHVGVGAGARSSLHEFGAGSSFPNLGQFVQLQ